MLRLTPLSRHRLAIFYRYLAVRLQYIPGYLCYLPRPVGQEVCFRGLLPQFLLQELLNPLLLYAVPRGNHSQSLCERRKWFLFQARFLRPMSHDANQRVTSPMPVRCRYPKLGAYLSPDSIGRRCVAKTRHRCHSRYLPRPFLHNSCRLPLSGAQRELSGLPVYI